MNRTTPKNRLDRYQSVLAVIADRDSFELSEIKTTCAEEIPAFVTRVLNELTKDGWLIREDDDELHYRWSKDPGELADSRWLEKKVKGNTIPAAPAQDRPRERLLAFGVENLRTAELIAILIRSGRQGESAVQAGERVAMEYLDRMDKLPDAAPQELKAVSSVIANTAYCQIMAGIELGRRIAEAKSENRQPTKICSASDAVAFCEMQFRRLANDSAKEEFHIVTLNTKNQVIATHQISIGTLDASLVHPREVFRAAIKDAASSIILVHNHPSGDPTPSREDHAVTERLEKSGEMIGINVLDHIIVTPFRCVSLRDA